MKNYQDIFNFSDRSNNPYKNDPTKQDERDNDPTRIRPEHKPGKEQPSTPSTPEEPGALPSRKNTKGNQEEEPYKRESPVKIEKQKKSEEAAQGSEASKRYNPASPEKSESDTLERDDEGTIVLHLSEAF
jgi:hypothetical protein